MFQIAPSPGYTMELEWLYLEVSWRYLIFYKCVEKNSLTFSSRFSGSSGWIRKLRIQSQILIESRNSPAKFHRNRFRGDEIRPE